MNNIYWKRATLFSIFCICTLCQSQILKRSSDDKEFPSLTITNKGINKEINHDNFKKFQFKKGDSILFNKIKFAYKVSNDTLIFYDKASEIEEIQFHKNKSKYTSAGVSNNCFIANPFLFSNDNFPKKLSYITLYPHNLKPEGLPIGEVDIKILKDKDGYPNFSDFILDFTVNLSTLVKKNNVMNNWKIKLPNTLFLDNEKYYLVLYFKSENASKNLFFEVNKNTYSFMYFHEEKLWKKYIRSYKFKFD
jgi:hypothetical protein